LTVDAGLQRAAHVVAETAVEGIEGEVDTRVIATGARTGRARNVRDDVLDGDIGRPFVDGRVGLKIAKVVAIARVGMGNTRAAPQKRARG
jgi:hypothetical protein